MKQFLALLVVCVSAMFAHAQVENPGWDDLIDLMDEVMAESTTANNVFSATRTAFLSLDSSVGTYLSDKNRFWDLRDNYGNGSNPPPASEFTPQMTITSLELAQIELVSAPWRVGGSQETDKQARQIQLNGFLGAYAYASFIYFYRMQYGDDPYDAEDEESAIAEAYSAGYAVRNMLHDWWTRYATLDMQYGYPAFDYWRAAQAEEKKNQVDAAHNAMTDKVNELRANGYRFPN